MISNFLKGGTNEAINAFNSSDEYENYLFTGEREISETLVVLVILCVPLFLCVKPCVNCCMNPEGEDHHGHGNAHQGEVAAEEELAEKEGLISGDMND